MRVISNKMKVNQFKLNNHIIFRGPLQSIYLFLFLHIHINLSIIYINLSSVMPWSTKDLAPSIWHKLYLESLKPEMKSEAYSRLVQVYVKLE